MKGRRENYEPKRAEETTLPYPRTKLIGVVGSENLVFVVKTSSPLAMSQQKVCYQELSACTCSPCEVMR